MLRRPASAGAVVTGLLMAGVWSGTAHAGGGKVVCDAKGVCRVVAEDSVTTPGQDGGNGSEQTSGKGTGDKPECYDSNMVSDFAVPCFLDGFGYWVNGRNCYFQISAPQPPAGDPSWEGHEPGDGAVYDAYCPDNPNMNADWFAQPPNGAGAAVDPAVLALQAVDKMRLRGPDIGITPKPGGKGVVGMPVYMWTETGVETYGPNIASASAGGITVTATAKVTKIVWKMGDGQAVTCTSAGTPYKAAYGKQPSPDCGYRYAMPSSTTGTGKFHVTATSTWTIDWQVNGGGQAGQLTEIRNSAVDIAVAEVQVLS